MNYQTYTPTPELSKYVKCYWILESSVKTDLVSAEKIFPDGCIELIFHYGDLFMEFRSNHASDLGPRSFVYGQLEKFIEIRATGKIGVLGIRFYPHGLRPFVRLDINEITGQSVAVQELWGREGGILEDKILNAPTIERRISLVEIFLLEKLRWSAQSDSVIERCVDSILRSDGNIAINDLANQLNVGRRHLERKFIASVGLSPKLLSRIVRFNNTLNLINHKQFSSLTMVAYEGGFYDQAHFIKDFKEFTGLNPKQFFSQDLNLAKYFNLD